MEGFIKAFKRASPTLLSCVGAIGVVATAVTAVRATPKALELIKTREWQYEEEGPCKGIDAVKIAWKPYIPSVAIGLGAIICIFGANGLNRKQQAALTSAYMLLDGAYKEYKNKVKELYGEDSDEKVSKSIARDKYVKSDQKDRLDSILFFDFFSGRYLERSMEEIIDAEYQLNREFALNDYVELNKFYALLGIDPVDYGDALGWSIGAGENFYNYQWLDFTHDLQVMDDGLECYIIHMVNPPTADFMDYC